MSRLDPVQLAALDFAEGKPELGFSFNKDSVNRYCHLQSSIFSIEKIKQIE